MSFNYDDSDFGDIYSSPPRLYGRYPRPQQLKFLLSRVHYQNVLTHFAYRAAYMRRTLRRLPAKEQTLVDVCKLALKGKIDNRNTVHLKNLGYVYSISAHEGLL